jgi:hypothetical protein
MKVWFKDLFFKNNATNENAQQHETNKGIAAEEEVLQCLKCKLNHSKVDASLLKKLRIKWQIVAKHINPESMT